MIRKLLCQLCAKDSLGYTVLCLSNTRNRFVSLTTAGLRCDDCNAELSGIVVAHTLILRRDERMMDWETVFGTLIPVEAVMLVDRLEKP